MSSTDDQLNYSETNQAWLIHREDFKTQNDGHCNLYVIIDAHSQYCFSQIVCKDLPSATEFLKLLNEAKKKASSFPSQILIANKDPAIQIVRAILDGLKIRLALVSSNKLQPLVASFSHAFREFQAKANEELLSKQSPHQLSEDARSLIPEPYGPCPCASGKKFKFCCQPAFKSMIFAMNAANEERDCQKALRYMEEAERAVGLTAEVLCRYAIVWSFFDKLKCKKYIQDALKANPNHPRSNYIMGIESVEEEKFQEAVVFYTRAIEHYPKEDRFHLNETYNNLGTAYYNLGNIGAAKEAWEKGLLYFPSDKLTFRNLVGYIYGNATLPERLRQMSPEVKKVLGIKN